MSKQVMNRAYLGQALIHKADAARALGHMGERVTCLTDGFNIAVEVNNIKRLNQAIGVISHVPPHTNLRWRRINFKNAEPSRPACLASDLGLYV